MSGAFAMIALESALTLLAAIVLGIGMVDPKRRDGRPEALTAAIGFTVLFAGTFFGLSPLGEAFGGAWGVGPLSVLYKRLFLAAGALTALLACPSGEPKPSIPRGRLGEALGLMVFSVTGMCVLVSSRELALLYTGLELVTMPLVALVAFHPREPRGAEAGLKYVFTSALSSGFLLYGLSFVYGLTGTTMIAEVAERLPAGPLTLAALIMVMVGVGFKISAVPFHLWAPDVYEGGPVVVSAFLAVASKAAGFALFAKVVGVAFARVGDSVSLLVALLAVVTHDRRQPGRAAPDEHQALPRLFLDRPGRLPADRPGPRRLPRRRLGRLLPAGLPRLLPRGLRRGGDRRRRDRARGHARVHRALGVEPAAGVRDDALALLALGHPAAGRASSGSSTSSPRRPQKGMAWLVLVGAVNSTVSLFYYLTVIRWMYIEKPTAEQSAVPPIRTSNCGGAVLAICTVGDAGARPAAADPALGRVRRRRRVLIPGSAGRAFLAPAALRRAHACAAGTRPPPRGLVAALPGQEIRSRPTRDRTQVRARNEEADHQDTTRQRRQPLTELISQTSFAARSSSSVMRRSRIAPRSSSWPRNVPASRPHSTGGVQYPSSSRTTTLAIVDSVTSPSSFTRMTSSHPGAPASARS